MESNVRKHLPGLFLLTVLRSGLRLPFSAVCNFSFSTNGKTYVPLGQPFNARQGRWIGAKVGIFAVGQGAASEMGYADYDWFRVE